MAESIELGQPEGAQPEGAQPDGDPQITASVLVPPERTIRVVGYSTTIRVNDGALM